ncbi:MAG: tRNA (guanosine(37)-N1)-methyltransferase TrmD [Betaproteobacteria bacterium]|nr:MAG: tRNA (guanosine(37)-N1)-methyltransferase TrmD [Betaproteobacteria bacterium]
MQQIMPRYDVISLFPEMFSALTQHGVSGRALQNGLAQLQVWDPRAFTLDAYRTVDDRPFGGGPGMVMLAEPLDLAITAIKAEWRRAGLEVDGTASSPRLIYLSPQGRVLNQTLVEELGQAAALGLLCGRYEGVDERVLTRHQVLEVSIGDFVLSGGELPAMVVLDALIRRLPGALGNAQSAEEDSFATGVLDCPHYTRPEVYLGQAVPEVLRSGNHSAIARWRLQQALGRTAQRRPDVLARRVATQPLSGEEQDLLASFEAGKVAGN